MAACTLLVSHVAVAQDAPPPVAPAPPAAATSSAEPAPGGAAPRAASGAPAVAKPDDKEDPKNKPAPNSVFIEGLGAGIFYSLNYERRFVDDLGVRIGFSYVSAWSTFDEDTADGNASLVTVPVTVEYLGFRGRKSGLELGGGMTLAVASGGTRTILKSGAASATLPVFTSMVGYRLHPAGGAGFQFRVGLGLLAGQGFGIGKSRDYTDFGVAPWFHLSLGAGF